MEPTVLHGKGQMPHHLCLSLVTDAEWWERCADDGPDLRVPYANKWITLQAEMANQAHSRQAPGRCWTE